MYLRYFPTTMYFLSARSSILFCRSHFPRASVFFLRTSVSQCPEKNARPPHMRAFNKAVAVVFNSSGDDNCGLRDGLLVKDAAAVRLDFRAVIAACYNNANQELLVRLNAHVSSLWPRNHESSMYSLY